jgi:hypothetical protein
MGCREKAPIVSIYSVAWWPWCAGKGRPWRGVYGARRGRLGCAPCRRRLGDASALDGAPNDGLWRSGDGGVRAVPWRRVDDHGGVDGAGAS